MKDNINPLRDMGLTMGQDTARPMISEDILEKVGEEDENSEGSKNILNLSDPKFNKENETEELDSVQIMETEEDILKKKIETAVK